MEPNCYACGSGSDASSVSSTEFVPRAAKAFDITPSGEQQHILNNIKGGYNILGDCVAGSGKTTSVLLIAQNNPRKKIVQITYNSQLKSEVRQKAKVYGIENIEIHTYHSLVVKYYDHRGHDDAVVRKIIEKKTPPSRFVASFDILIVDEAQDMTLLYYRLVNKFIKDMRRFPQMVVLGDQYQAIYKFKDADPRFLTLAPRLWACDFTPVTLTTSYRLTNQIAAFVNEIMLGRERIKAIRDGPRVLYTSCDVWNSSRVIARRLQDLIEGGTIKPDDIFVLAPSIKSPDAPIRRLENALVALGIPCFYPTSDDRKLDEDVIRGKVVFSTYHQSKGRERKVVLVYGFDISYFEFVSQGADETLCPEALYVAATRASEHLILIKSIGKRPLPFLKKKLTAMRGLPYLTIYEPHKNDPDNYDATYTAPPPDPEKRVTVTELVKFLKEHHIKQLQDIMPFLLKETTAATFSVSVPNKIMCENGKYEDVSELTGIAIPAMFEVHRTGKSTIQESVNLEYDNIQRANDHQFLRECYAKLPTPICTVPDYIYLTVMYVSLTGKIYHKLAQMQRFDWLTGGVVAECMKPLYENLSEAVRFERPIEHTSMRYSEYGRIKIVGRVDAIDDAILWEIKCVGELSLEHFLQLIVYAWVWNCEHEHDLGPRQFKILNITTGQVFELDRASHLIEEVMKILFDNRFRETDVISDGAFVDLCMRH